MDHNTDTLANETVTDTETSSQAAAKSYSQTEVDNMMARMRGTLERKFEKQFEDLGSIDELKQLKTEAELRAQEQQLKRGEFEKTLQEKAAKWEAEIQKRDSIITDYKLNMPLLNAAAKHKAVNPEQVQALLRNNIRLNEDGNAEVLDSTGAVRYDDAGNLYKVEAYVEEWLHGNPHFLSAAPSTTNTKSSVRTSTTSEIDLTTLDLTNPENRKLYKEARSKGLI
jgi:hypothetical protein